MKETEPAEMEFKERQLEFEEKKNADLLEDHQRERVLEKEKEESRAKLELEKIKIMIELSMQNVMSGVKELIEKQK